MIACSWQKTTTLGYILVYFLQMASLQGTSKELYNNFLNGVFSIQLGDSKPFYWLPTDQTFEETMNRNTKTSSGTMFKD
jgi:hypothetical protein